MHDPRLCRREDWTRERTLADACAALAEAGNPAGPSHSAADVAGDAHLRAHGMLLELARPDGGDPLLVAGNPVRMDGATPTPGRRRPALGEHTVVVVREELGLCAAEIADLQERGVVGGPA